MEATQLQANATNARQALVEMNDSARRRLRSLAPALGKAKNMRAVAKGGYLVERTSGVLTRAAHAFSKINAFASNLASVAMNQASSITERNSAVRYPDRMTREHAVMAEQSSAACAALARETRDMSGLVNRFRIESR